MKIFFISMLFISQISFAAKDEITVDGMLQDVVERYNASQNLEGVAKNLILEDETRKSVLSKMKEEKVLKVPVGKITLNKSVIQIENIKIDFSGFSKGFVKINNKNVQVLKGKAYGSYLEEVRAVLSPKAFFSLFESAYASNQFGEHSISTLLITLPEAQAKYTLCLSRRADYDKQIGKATEQEVDLAYKLMMLACRENRPVAASVAALALAGDQISSLECKDGRLQRLTTKNKRSFILKGDSVDYVYDTIKYSTSDDLNSQRVLAASSNSGNKGIYCGVKFKAECFKRYWAFGVEDCELGESEFVSNSNKSCESDEGYARASVIFDSANRCCSDYPANVIKVKNAAGKAIVTENLCLAGLRVLEDEKGAAAKKLQELYPAESGVK